MTPIPLPLPAGRILPPTVAYAAGLVCEHRPDLADGVRAAVLGDAPEADLHRMFLTCGAAGDGQGNAACYCLRLFVEQPEPTHADRSYLHALADVLGIIPRRTAEMRITTGDGEERDGDPTIGDNYFTPEGGHAVCGLGDGVWARPAWRVNPYHKPFAEEMASEDGGCLLNEYLLNGWHVAWLSGGLVGEREALRRLIPLHAHTISLDPAARAAWAKAHLDALNPPIRPQSPDRLT